MLQKPYDISLRAKTIDANESNEVTWKVSGDVQTAFKIDILSNLTNSLVWTSNKIMSYSLKYIIPPSVLTNDWELKIRVTIYNQASESITSDAEVFQTSARPVVSVITIGTVKSFSYNFAANYYQAQNNPIRSYIAILYDEKRNLIDKSTIKTTLPMAHLFTGLQTETEYYIEFQATSSKGLTGTSGLIPFDVFYYRPKMNVDLRGKNIPDAGIEISWFVRQIIGTSTGSSFINNEKLDTTNGNKAYFDSGFTIDADFSMKIWLENIPSKKNLILLKGETGNLTLQYDAVLEKFTLKKTIDKSLSSTWTSNGISSNSYCVLIQQINNQINLSATTL